MPRFSLAESTQGIVCAGNQGGKKLIYVNYANSGGRVCRTSYDDGGGYAREIAWARNNTQFCTDVAYRLMHKFTAVGWRCNADTAMPRPQLKPAHFTNHNKPKAFRHHRKARASFVDSAFLESIKK